MIFNRKGKEVNKGTRLRLEEELRKMIEKFDQNKSKQERPVIKTGRGNVIRRRAGEQDKRISV